MRAFQMIVTSMGEVVLPVLPVDFFSKFQVQAPRFAKDNIF